MITRDQIVETARSYLGVRFARSGRDRNRGIDCVGLLTLVGRDLGLDIKDIINYDFEPRPDEFLRIIRTQTNPVPMGVFRPGTVVLLKQSIYPMHCGILARTDDGLTIINANLHKRKVIEEPIANWRKDIIELRDYKGII